MTQFCYLLSWYGPTIWPVALSSQWGSTEPPRSADWAEMPQGGVITQQQAHNHFERQPQHSLAYP